MRRTASLTSWFTSDVFRKREPARDMRMVRILCRSKPGATALNAAKVRMLGICRLHAVAGSAANGWGCAEWTVSLLEHDLGRQRFVCLYRLLDLPQSIARHHSGIERNHILKQSPGERLLRH